MEKRLSNLFISFKFFSLSVLDLYFLSLFSFTASFSLSHFTHFFHVFIHSLGNSINIPRNEMDESWESNVQELTDISKDRVSKKKHLMMMRVREKARE